jgi:Zn-finger protein
MIVSLQLVCIRAATATLKEYFGCHFEGQEVDHP